MDSAGRFALLGVRSCGQVDTNNLTTCHGVEDLQEVICVPPKDRRSAHDQTCQQSSRPI